MGKELLGTIGLVLVGGASAIQIRTMPAEQPYFGSESYRLLERGWEAEEAGDSALAFELYRQGAEAGDISMMVNLGYLFDTGRGQAPDKAAAMLWYKRAHRRGSGIAAGNIAILYNEQGKHRAAFRWFKKAVEVGDNDARVKIAKAYLSGVGVRRSARFAKEQLQAAISCEPREAITEAGWEEAVAMLADLDAAT